MRNNLLLKHFAICIKQIGIPWRYVGNRRYYYEVRYSFPIWYIYEFYSSKINNLWTLSIIQNPFGSYHDKWFFTKKGAFRYMDKLGLTKHISHID